MGDRGLGRLRTCSNMRLAYPHTDTIKHEHVAQRSGFTPPLLGENLPQFYGASCMLREGIPMLCDMSVPSCSVRPEVGHHDSGLDSFLTQ